MDRSLLIRHGHSVYMEKGLTGGWTDLPLTALGQHQARCTGRYLAENRNDLSEYDFYCSTLLRASETASIMGSLISLEPRGSAALREIHNGQAAYCTRREAQKMEHPLTEPVMDWVPYPDAESWRVFRERVIAFMERISGEKILLVAHSNVIITIIHWWLELDESTASRISFDIDPCSITLLRTNRWQEKTLSILNRTAHLIPYPAP